MFLNRKTGIQLGLIASFLIMVIWLFSDIVAYLMVSLVISSILRPITDYVDNIEIFRLKVPRILAVFFSFIVLATIPVLFILLFVPLILEQITVLQSLDFGRILERVREPINQVDLFVINNFQPEGRQEGFLMEEINNWIVSLVDSIRIGPVLNYLLQFTGTIFIYLLAVSFITFFLLYEKGIIRRSLLSTIPNAYFEVVITAIYKIEKLLSNYLIGLLLQIMIMFIIITLGLSLTGVKYALTIAVFAAIINLIPYVGPVAGFLFALVVIVSTRTVDTSFQYYLFLALKTFPVFAAAQLIDNLLLQPLIFSKSVKAHPLEIFIVIFAGAALAGGLGMIIAIPVYTIIRVSYIELSKGYKQYRIFKSTLES